MYARLADEARLSIEKEKKKLAQVNLGKAEIASRIDAMTPVEHMQGFITQTHNNEKGGNGSKRGKKGKGSSNSSGIVATDKSGRRFHIDSTSLVQNLAPTLPPAERASTIAAAITSPPVAQKNWASPGPPGAKAKSAKAKGKGKQEMSGKSDPNGKGKGKSEKCKGKDKGKEKGKEKGKNSGQNSSKGKSKGRGRGKGRGSGEGKGKAKSGDWW